MNDQLTPDQCAECGWRGDIHAWLCPTKPPFARGADGSFVRPAEPGPTRNELRQAVLAKLDTFTRDVQWIGGSADLAFADAIVANMRQYAVGWLRQVAADIEAEVPRYTATTLRKQADKLAELVLTMGCLAVAGCRLTVPHHHPQLESWAANVAQGAESAHHVWLEWLVDIGYGVDFTCTPPPPCEPADLAAVYAETDGESVESWTAILLDGNTAGGWYGNGQDHA